MDSKLKAMFREEGRRLLARDRSARKYGQSNDLAGEITAALSTAYKLGVEHGQNPRCAASKADDPEAPIAWELVPPTSRNILRSLTYSYSTRFGPAQYVADHLEGYVDPQSGRLRWRVVSAKGHMKHDNHSFADKGVAPLVRLGLLASDGNGTERLSLTNKGDLTCRLYWPRDDRSDPTLPLMSTRA